MLKQNAFGHNAGASQSQEGPSSGQYQNRVFANSLRRVDAGFVIMARAMMLRGQCSGRHPKPSFNSGSEAGVRFSETRARICARPKVPAAGGGGIIVAYWHSFAPWLEYWHWHWHWHWRAIGRLLVSLHLASFSYFARACYLCSRAVLNLSRLASRHPHQSEQNGVC